MEAVRGARQSGEAARTRRSGSVRAADGAARTVEEGLAADRERIGLVVARLRWGGVLLGVVEAFLTTSPRPIGGPWIVLAAALAMAAYNVPAMAIHRIDPRRQAGVLRMLLAGDFLVCTVWTLCAANDVYSTAYAVFTAVAVEAAVLERRRGVIAFLGAFVCAYVALYTLRWRVYGYPLEPGSVVFRSTVVALVALLVGGIAEESQRRLRAALEASADKTRFLARVSHELRTPLSAIIGFAELLEMSDLGERERHYVGTLLGASRHMSDMVADVLDVSRVDDGELRLRVEVVNVRHVVEESAAMVGAVAAARGIEVRTEVDPSLGVVADPRRLRQILLNYLSNAVKYNRDGGEVRCVAAEDPDGDGAAVRIAVADTGPGIAAAELGRLFSPFERLDADRTTVEGTGLGLAVTRRLAEAMGGAVGAASVPGESSTFWVTLPAAR